MIDFICACCNETFPQEWTDEEALEEKKELFGDMPLEEMEKVCDECFYKLMKFNEHPGF